MKYISKQIIIEATQWFKDGDHPKVIKSIGTHKVEGAQGWSQVDSGDWIIKEPFGDGYYPCKDNVFKSKYEIKE